MVFLCYVECKKIKVTTCRNNLQRVELLSSSRPSVYRPLLIIHNK